MPSAYVKPYVKRGKTDAGDAEAICEAVIRPTMRFVPVKPADRQAALLDHGARDVLVRQRTQIANAIRAHSGEFGVVVATGIHDVDRMIKAARDVPHAAVPAFDTLAGQLRDTQARIEEGEAEWRILRWTMRPPNARIGEIQGEDELARRLATVSGVAAFRSARDNAAWLGLRPWAHSSGGKERLGRISKAGNRYLRGLLYLGAMTSRCHANGPSDVGE